MRIDSSESPASVFVSHTGSDDGLADAIRFAIEGLCQGARGRLEYATQAATNASGGDRGASHHWVIPSTR